MATDPGFIEYVHEQAAFGARLSHKRMFGEYAMYLDGKVVAFACDNSLLLKPTAAGKALLPRVTPGKPYPEAKDYYVVDEFLDDTPLLQRLLQATADVLPAPKPKPVSKKRPGTKADATKAANLGASGAAGKPRSPFRSPSPAAASAPAAKSARAPSSTRRTRRDPGSSA